MSVEQTSENVSFLDLPDEELAKYNPTSLPFNTEVKQPEGEGEGQGTSADESNGQAAGNDEGAQNKGTEDEAKEAAQGAAGDAAGADAGKASEGEGKTAPLTEEKPAEKVEPKTEEKVEKADQGEKKPDDSFDYKTAYERLTAPFKANGKEFRVENVDEAIQLMQMGANYTKKMAGLKPSLAILKMLEGNGLLNEDKINYLIDLDKKNPQAITKLLKDSGLDPMDLDAKKAEGYKPPSHKVDTKELELDEVMDEIQHSPAYPRTLEVVGKTWDATSRGIVAQHPQLLKVINAQIESGVFDQITAKVERDRLFGKFTGVSDIEAYRQVGAELQAQTTSNSPGRQEQPKVEVKQIVQPKPEKTDDEALKKKKIAAGGSKPTTPAAPAQDFNPLALSDEEFSKIRIR